MNRYFHIDWNVHFGMNRPLVQIHLARVYLCLFCTMLTSSSGAYLHLLWNIGGLLTLVACVGTGTCLILLHPSSEGKRVSFLMATAFCEGASIGPLIDLVYKTDPGIIFSAFVAIDMAFGCFSAAAMLTVRRGYIYLGGLLSSSLLIPIWLHFASIAFGDYPTIWKIALYGWLMLYLLSVVVYSQWIVAEAHLGGLDYVKDALILFATFAIVPIHLITA